MFLKKDKIFNKVNYWLKNDQKKWPYILISLLGAYFVLQLIYINSDPQFYITFSRVIDQGYWLHDAKNFFYWQELIRDNFNYGLYTSAFYVLATIPFSFIVGKVWLAGKLVSLLASVFFIFLVDWGLKTYFPEIKNRLLMILLILLNYPFFQHANLALPEMLSFALIIPAFFLLLGKREKDFFYSGIFFALAYLAKNPTGQLLPGLGLFLIYESFRRKTIKPLINFSLGSLPPVLIFYAFCYQAGLLTKLISVIESVNFFPKNLAEFWQRLVGFPERGFWTIAPNFFLIIIPWLYFFQMIFRSLLAKKWLFSRKEIWLYSWIIGGSFLYTLADFQPSSRLLPLIVPLAILSFTKILQISLKKLVLSYQKYFRRKDWPIAFILSTGVGVVLIKVCVFLTKRIGFLFLVSSQNQILAGLILIVLTTILFLRIKRRIRFTIVFATWFSLIFIMSTLTAYILIKQLVDEKFLILTAAYVLRTSLGIIVFISLFLAFFILGYLSKRGTRVILTGILILYFMVNSYFLGYFLIKPEFTLDQASQKIADLAGEGISTISGTGAAILVLDHKIYLIHYAPKENLFYGLMSDSEKNWKSVDFFSRTLVFDGWDNQQPLPDFVKADFRKVGEYQLMKIPYKNNYQGVIELWQRNK